MSQSGIQGLLQSGPNMGSANRRLPWTSVIEGTWWVSFYAFSSDYLPFFFKGHVEGQPAQKSGSVRYNGIPQMITSLPIPVFLGMLLDQIPCHLQFILLVCIVRLLDVKSLQAEYKLLEVTDSVNFLYLKDRHQKPFVQCKTGLPNFAVNNFLA